MCRAWCVLAMLALCMGLAHSFSWDIVITKAARLEFYNNKGTLIHTEVIPSFDFPYVTYDASHKRVLFADRYYRVNVIFSFDIATKKIQYLTRTKGEYIQSLTYDPVTDSLFWIETGISNITSFSLKPGPNNEVYEHFTPKLGDVWPREIAVDSCGGFIYWIRASSIYRARLNGSKEELLVYYGTTFSFWRYGLSIDQQTQKMYWITIDLRNGHTFSIEYADLNGKNMKTLYVTEINDESIMSKQKTYELLAVSKDFVYWGCAEEPENFWQLPKNPAHDKEVKPKQIFTTPIYSQGVHMAIATNYKIEDQTQGIKNCEALKSLRPLNECQGYCLNHGTCSLNNNSEAVCLCTEDYEGERCDVSVFLSKCFQTISMLKDILDTDLTPVSLNNGMEPTCASTVVRKSSACSNEHKDVKLLKSLLPPPPSPQRTTQ